MAVTAFNLSARLPFWHDDIGYNPIKLWPFNPDPMPTPIDPLPSVPVDPVGFANPVKLFPFNPDHMPTPIAPIAEDQQPPVSTGVKAQPLDGGFTISADSDGNVVCGQGPVNNAPLYADTDILKPTAVGMTLQDDGGFILTIGPDGTIVCGGAPAERFDLPAARPIAEPLPGHPLVCLPFEGVVTPLAAHDPLQALIDKFIYQSSGAETLGAVETHPPVAPVTVSLPPVFDDLNPVAHDVM